MKEVVDFLWEGKVLYLATSGVDGKPKVRPFGFMREKRASSTSARRTGRRSSRSCGDNPPLSSAAWARDLDG
jgi:hypothetical protein